MYNPKYSKKNDLNLIYKVLNENAFATLVTNDGGKIEATHLPFLIEKSGETFKLTAHLARANPIWKNFKNEVVVIFQGPHTYVTPAWYKNPLNVPTWNYVSVHCYGSARLVENAPDIKKILTDTVHFFETAYKSNWKYELPEKFEDSLIKAIIGFEISVTKVEAKFKLSQNREPVDYEGVIKGLSARKDEMSQALLRYMKEVK